MTRDEIARLDTYSGSTPPPKDFDEFWERQMKESDQIPLEFDLTLAPMPSFDNCLCYELWFRGLYGAGLCARYLRPRSGEAVPLVLQFHGYPGAARSWLELAAFVGMGNAVIALDCPGQGGKSEDTGGYLGTTVFGHLIAGLDGPPEEMYYVRLQKNIRILCRIVQRLEGIDLQRVFVNGASQGGALALACAALNRDLVQRAAVLYPFLSDYRMVWELGADTSAYEGLRYYSRWFDPRGDRLDEWMRRLGYIDTKNFAHMVSCPVLFGTGLDDAVCPPITQCAVYNQLCCPKRRCLFEGCGHEEISDFNDLLLDFFGAAVLDNWEELSCDDIRADKTFGKGSYYNPKTI